MGGKLKPSCSRIIGLPGPASRLHRSWPRPPLGEGNPWQPRAFPAWSMGAAEPVQGRGGAQHSRGHGRPPHHTAGPTCSPPPLQAAPVLDLRPGNLMLPAGAAPGPPGSRPAHSPAWGSNNPQRGCCLSLQPGEAAQALETGLRARAQGPSKSWVSEAWRPARGASGLGGHGCPQLGRGGPRGRRCGEGPAASGLASGKPRPAGPSGQLGLPGGQAGRGAGEGQRATGPGRGLNSSDVSSAPLASPGSAPGPPCARPVLGEVGGAGTAHPPDV